jgi:hypothetical protein
VKTETLICSFKSLLSSATLYAGTALKTSDFRSKHICKRELRAFESGFRSIAPGAFHAVEGIADSLKMKADDMRRDPNRRNATLLRESADGGLAHLQNFGELPRG